MIEELKEKCEALAIRTRTDLEVRKREELEASLEEGRIADPFSGTILIGLLVSSAVSAASYLISSALAPKVPRQQQGKLTGSLQLQNSEQGIFIPEIYGGSPTTSFVAGSNLTYQNNANGTTEADSGYTKTSGGSTTWNSGASHNVQINSGDKAWVKFKVLSGYAAMGFTTTASPVSGNTDFKFGIQWNPDGSITIKYNGTQLLGAVTTWVAGDEFTVWLDTRFRLFKGAAEITPPNFIFPTPAFPLWVGIAAQAIGAGISEAKVQINNLGPAPNSGRGGIKVPAIIVWSSGIRKLVSTTRVPTGGGKGGGQRTQTVDNITYDIDLGMVFTAHGPHHLIREYANADILIDQFDQSPNPSGVYDPTVGPDPNYDPTLLPDPSLNFDLSNLRVDAEIPFDGDNVGTGTIQGGSSGFAIYPGNNTQQPDPTIEADIDGKYGAGSTPAYRNRSLIVHSALSLSRWGGVVPNITAVWEHETLRTYGLIFGSICERVGVLAANGDYDFSLIDGIPCRGLVITGRPFQPKEIIGSPDLQLAGNFFVTEAQGQIVAYPEGGEPSVTIPDTEIGWLEGDADLPDIAPEVDSAIAAEISLPREVHVKSLDPDNNWEPNTASAMRQITDGSTVELLEIQICQLSDERRETAQRKLYRDYVAGTGHKFTLPWTYLYLYPGYKITVTRAEGFTHVMRLTSIDGGIGILSCEGVALEPETFNQPANGVFPPGYIPPQPIPAMTVLTLIDSHLLRDGDETNNNGVGFYMAGTPRTGVNQSWQGYALYINRNNVWTLLPPDSTLPATIGTIVSVTGLSSDTSVFDRTGVITVDLYGTTAALSSITENDVLINGTANLAIFGDMVSQFVTATQVAGFPNRWQISVLLNGRRGTESHVSDSFTGKRFILIDNAVQFVPMDLTDLNNQKSYRAVTSGQSLDDAATVTFTWTGGTLRPWSVVNARGSRDSADNLIIEFEGRTRFGGGVRSSQFGALNEETEEYRVQILNSGSVTLPNGKEHIIPVPVTISLAGSLFVDFASSPDEFEFVDVNTLSVDGDNLRIDAHSVISILNTGNFVEATLKSGGSASIGLRDVAGNNKYSFTAAAGVGAGIYVTIGNATSIFVGTYSSGTEVRLRITLAGSEVRFYQDWAGIGTPPLYVASVPPEFPLVPYVQAAAPIGGGNATISKVILSAMPFPKTIYSASQQTEDGFTPGDPIQMDIWQVSRLVGEGDKVRITL
jgi:hypothetical protein